MRLVAEDLSTRRGGETVFSGIGFTLGRGEALVVTGANGAGKSTLLRLLAGLLPAAAGTVRLEDGGDEFPTVAAASHFVGHLDGMKPTLTLDENLRFWRDFLGAPMLPVGEALERVGLGGLGHLPFGVLSTGQRRRAALARLLASRRPVWLLDEPTAGLDAASGRRLAGMMADHLAEGGMLVAATHQPLGIDQAKRLELG